MLQDLGLSAMGLEHIEVGAFCNLRKISILNLNANKLQTLPELCALKCCIEEMFLAKNNISNLSKNVFEGYKKLKRLHLSRNKLIILPNLHWIQHSLREIRAAGNKIKSLSAFETTGVFEMLEYIDMGRNNISVFNVNILHHMPKLRGIQLPGNKLNHVDDFHFHYKNTINLKDNPWHCEKALSWMGKDDMGFEDGMVCEMPVCLRGNAIADMSK